MVRTLEFYGYDDTAFMNAVRNCCPGCHFNIKIDDDGYIHFVNGDELSVKLDIVYDNGRLCLFDALADEGKGAIVASGQPVAEIFEEMTSGQTFITSAVTSESGITFYTSDVMGESGQTIELPLPTLNIIEGDGIEVSATAAGTVISLRADIAEEIDELVAFSGDVVSILAEVENDLEETTNAINEVSSAVSGHTDAINELSADTKTISDNVDNLIESAETLNEKIDDEIDNRENADTILQVRIDAEESARTTADTALEQAINAEAAQREADDDALEQAITAETEARKDADTYISGVVSAISSAVTDNLEPRVATNERGISGLSAAVQTFQSGLEKEIDERLSGDNKVMDIIEESNLWVEDTLSDVVLQLQDDYKTLSGDVISASTAIATFQKTVETLSSATGSYEGFINPYQEHPEKLVNLLQRICDKIGIIIDE